MVKSKKCKARGGVSSKTQSVALGSGGAKPSDLIPDLVPVDYLEDPKKQGPRKAPVTLPKLKFLEDK